MDINKLHKGWHSRGYLPHLDAPCEIQAITFRLGDSVPKKVIESWKKELEQSPLAEREVRTRLAKYEDAGHGCCLLAEPENASIVQESLLHGDSEHYRLLEWCIMPNHVHVLVETFPGRTLGSIVKAWKTFTARAINKRRGKSGTLWALDYHDRYIRDQEHLDSAKSYIRNNPVHAKLCSHSDEWPWSSASIER